MANNLRETLEAAPPHTIETEQSLLGGILANPNTFHWIDALLPASEETFYHTLNVQVYKVLKELINNKRPFDLVILREELLKKNKEFPTSYLLDITKYAITPELNEEHAKQVSELYARRKIMEQCKAAIDRIVRNDNIIEIVGNLEMNLHNIFTSHKKMPIQIINEVALDWWTTFEANNYKPADRILTGWRDIDKYVSIVPGIHVMIGARTSMGKTSFAIKLATNIAAQGKRPLFFTMEQSKKEMAVCFISQIAQVNRFDLMTGNLNERQIEAVNRRKKEWSEDYDIAIDDKIYNAQEIKHKAIIEMTKNPVDVIIIDFLHNMKAPTGSRRDGYEWLRETSKQLEEIAKELNVPIVTLAQVSRKVEARDNKRPVASDLREGGEDNTDIIMFIYRDEYYYPDTTEKPGIAEIIIAKNRNGRTGTVELAFKDYTTEFLDLDRPAEERAREKESM